MSHNTPDTLSVVNGVGQVGSECCATIRKLEIAWQAFVILLPDHSTHSIIEQRCGEHARLSLYASKEEVCSKSKPCRSSFIDHGLQQQQCILFDRYHVRILIWRMYVQSMLAIYLIHQNVINSQRIDFG